MQMFLLHCITQILQPKSLDTGLIIRVAITSFPLTSVTYEQTDDSQTDRHRSKVPDH